MDFGSIEIKIIFLGGTMDQNPKQLNGRGQPAIDWENFQLEPIKEAEKSTGQVDADLETPVKIKDIDPPKDLTVGVPNKPKMMEYLTNYQSAKISKTQYLQELKAYAGAQTEIFKDQLEKTIAANKVLTEASLRGVHEKIRAWAQEITVVTDLSLQSTITRSITRAAEIADDALKNLAHMKNPHPMVQQHAMKSVVDTMQKTITNIQSGGAEIKGNSIGWRGND
jgi:hypothetical protein